MDARWLFLDMNSFFASCEQQEDPKLRHRALAVVPMDSNSTSVIAASYEAKAYGIRTGTNVGLAKRLCPGLLIIPVSSGHYIDYHKRIVETVARILPNPHVLSIDEMACRLWAGNENSDAAAVRIGLRIKAAIRDQVGEYLFCSVGIAPNVFLAKVASDLQKPNGLVLLRRDDVEAALASVPIGELPGVGRKMKQRLARHGILTIPQLYSASPSELRRVWGGVVGERWWHMLRGSEESDYVGMAKHETPKSVGHSHVLGPELRTDGGAERVLIRLTGKAVSRMRRKDCVATGVHVSVTYISERTFAKRTWSSGSDRRVPAEDPMTWVQAVRAMWNARPSSPRGWVPQKVGMVLTGIVAKRDLTLPLFETDLRKARLATAMDAINAALGASSVDVASCYLARDLAPERIAFSKISDDDRDKYRDEEWDEVDVGRIRAGGSGWSR
jgi:DNA polymerase-4